MEVLCEKTHVLSWEKQLMGCRRMRTCSKEQKVESAAETGGIIYTYRIMQALCWRSIFKRNEDE